MQAQIERCVKGAQYDTLQRAFANSKKILGETEAVVEGYLQDKGLDQSRLCFAIVGSVGRLEALEASDLDIVPVASDREDLAKYERCDGELRQILRDRLKLKVSEGRDLTKATCIDELIEAESIGGPLDTSACLTKRVLLLTESAQAAGALDINVIREKLLDAYGQERTSGRHVLSLCNDIARYYKTLHIEYKAKADEQNKDWCTRNVKLRHSRKMWYFANILAIATLAHKHPKGNAEFRSSLLESFKLTPIERLALAICETQPLSFGRLMETYCRFLEFMSDNAHRDALAKVQHGDRYQMGLANPFPMMKYSSVIMHEEMMAMVEELGPAMRARIMAWFLL